MSDKQKIKDIRKELKEKSAKVAAINNEKKKTKLLKRTSLRKRNR